MASTANQSISSFQCSFDTHITHQLHLPVSVIPKWIALVAIDVLASPLTVLINFLVIWTVLENEQLRSNNYNFMITVLSLSDLLVGLVVQPLYAALKVCFISQCSRVCDLIMAYTASGVLCSAWTVVTIVIISLERYLFIKHPLYYHTSVTSKKLMIAMAASWIIVGTTIPSTWLQVHESMFARQFPVILIFAPSFIIILFCVTKVNLTAFRQMRAIAALHMSVVQQSKVKEYKRTFILGSIVLASVACLCPILVLKIVAALKGKWTDDMNYLQGVAATILHLQSLINPIIYSIRLSDIRSGVAKRLRCNRQ